MAVRDGRLSQLPEAEVVYGDEFLEIIHYNSVAGKWENFKLPLSLVGGAAGQSAYQVAVANGFSGTESQWLASLIGDSAYQVAVDNGFVGNVSAWLDSLKGADGTDGASAYQLAVSQGFSGDLATWLLSLKGEPGDPGTPGVDGDDGAPGTTGLSAYQVAVNAGFVGDEAAWLLSLKGDQGEAGTNATAFPATPKNRRIAILGDSITAQCSSTTVGLENYGYLSHALRAADQRFIFDPLTNNYGVGGDTSAMAMARVASVIASGVGTCILAVGTNDRTSSMTADDTIANLLSMRDDLMEAGIHVILVVPLPRGESVNTDKRLTALQLGYAMEVRRRILETLEKPGCWVVDTWPVMADLTTTTGDIKLGYTHDGLHPTPLGAYWMGQVIAEVMKKVIGVEAFLPLANINYFNATDNLFGLVTTNPMMTGTAGAEGTGGSGDLADDYSGSNATGTTAVSRTYSKVTTATGDWQQCVVGGSAATAAAAIDLARQISLQAKVVPGGVYEAVCEFENDADITNIMSFQLGLHVQDSTTTVLLWDGDRYTSPHKLPNIANKGVMRTPRITVPAGVTDVRIRLSCYMATDGAPTGTFRFRKMGIRRVG